MKRTIFSLLLALILCAGLSVTAFAASQENFLVDEADILTDREEEQLNSQLSQISQTHGAQILIVTVSSLGAGDVSDFTEYVYDELNLGYGENRDGVLLLVCMDPREYRILSNGFAADAITLDTIDRIGDRMVDDLSDGDYAGAFATYIERCDYYLDGYLNGFPFQWGKTLLIALVVGLVAALIVTAILKGQLKSVYKQHAANVYVKPGSMQLSVSRDLYLYRNVTRTKRQSSSSSGSGGRSGGSRNVGGGSF